MNITLTLALIELILLKGPELAIKLLRTSNMGVPTIEDIIALKDIKDPEEYFE